MTAANRFFSLHTRGVLWSMALSGLVLVVCACASASQQGQALHALSAQTGVRLESYGQAPPQSVADTLRTLLGQPLTVEAAVQVAALNSPRFQALLQKLDIAQADLRQGRLLPNPALELAIRSGGGRDFEYTLLEDLKGILLYPLNRGLANARYAQTRMHLAGELLDGIAQVKVACFTLQGLLQTRSLLASTLQTTQASAALAIRQQQAGNINALETAMHQATLQETRLAVEGLEADIQTARQTLGQLLGFSGDEWQIADTLPPLPGDKVSLPELEQLALTRHPDLEAAREEARAAEQALQVARFSVLPSLQAGVTLKKEEARRTAGPALALELPLFDWGQATRARARAQNAQSRHQVRAVEAEVRAQVRTQFTHMELARKTAQACQDTLIPLRTQVVAETQKHYNYMLLGVYQLLQARQEETAARQQYVSALADYWIARAQLERAIGGPLPPGSQRAPEPAPAEEKNPPQPTPAHPHHH